MVKPWSTWQDQLGAEGEFYHIWRSVNFLLTGSQFQENVSATYLGTVTDGIQEFLAEIEPEIDRAFLLLYIPVKLFTNTAQDLITLRVWSRILSDRCLKIHSLHLCLI